jgi:glycosyltransferase involved in cell wall biosynthesis
MDGFLVRRLSLLPESKRRVGVRALNAVVFAVRVALRVARGGFDVVMFSSMPPVVLGLGVLAAQRSRGQGGYVYHLQDVYPEAAGLAGDLDPSGRAFRLLRYLDTRVCRSARRVIVLSQDMKQTIADRGVAADRIEVINNFPLAAAPVVSFPVEPPEKHFTVLFAGNLGRFQGLETVLEAISRLRDHEEIRFRFVGKGLMRPVIERRIREEGLSQVELLPHVSPEDALGLMAGADLGLVTLLAGVARVAYPSKTMSYLSCGCRILAMVEGDSELATMLAEADLGASVDPGDAAGLAQAILAEARRERTQQERVRVRQFAAQRFGREAVLGQWRRLYADLSREQASSLSAP